jgi:hypothetical protein
MNADGADGGMSGEAVDFDGGIGVGGAVVDVGGTYGGGGSGDLRWPVQNESINYFGGKNKTLTRVNVLPDRATAAFVRTQETIISTLARVHITRDGCGNIIKKSI